jgi:hypothetical protein
MPDSQRTMGEDAKGDKDRAALGTLAKHCGARVRELIRADPKRFSPKKVRALAGTAPEYQRHVTGRAAAGDANPFRVIAATLLAYDTVAFREVTSRLHRALGMIRKEAAVLERARARGQPPNRLADRLLTLDLIAEQAGRLHDLLAAVEPADGHRGKKSKARKSDSKLTDKLHAAGGLGLIAKNVRNVAALQPAHRPTREQKELALRLTTESRAVAAAARGAGRRAFERADDNCRVRPRGRATRRVITHDKPDGDAAAAAWLAERFLFADEPVEVLFVPRARVWGAWRDGDCVVDVGNTHDPENLFFDHKPPAFENRHDSCAARLVWDRLVRLGRPVGHLRPLVDVVFAGDSTWERAWFRDEYAASRRAGFHKALADARAADESDAGVYRAARRWLDNYHTRTLPPRGRRG